MSRHTVHNDKAFDNATNYLLREKWDEAHYADGSTYGEKTIERAIADTSEFYYPDARDDSSDASSIAATETSYTLIATCRAIRCPMTFSGYDTPYLLSR